MLPADLNLSYAFAMLFLLGAWFAYPLIFKLLNKSTINTQLIAVRRNWMRQISRHRSPFDSILMGHIVHSVAFFGSATLIVLAGLFSVIINLETVYGTMANLHFVTPTSLELFSLIFALLAVVLTISFFSFVYALRKLAYSVALIGALPSTEDGEEPAALNDLIEGTTMVITEAVKTFNFGIRGYYYAIAAMFLFASPLACIGATLIATTILVYRQLSTTTASSIGIYVNKDIKGASTK